ncbi:hypothetical protein [Streptomyces sp. HUAS TT7]|uniref:hypothetical protein n=1 Tax=Streptomyces sp. HUAS TT7 TaxID=3447507 RepID=UPI003F6576FF
MTAAALDLSVGAALVLDEDEWHVERREPHTGRVHLIGHDGSRQCLTFRFLANHPHCRSSSRTVAAGADRGRQPKSPGDLKSTQLDLAKLRFAHLTEINTGFRSGPLSKPGRASRNRSATRT